MRTKDALENRGSRMRKLFSFMVMTLDGYTEGPNQEFDWPNVDDEFDRFSLSQLNDVDVLLFGKNTYVMMANYWPSPDARREDPATADAMNDAEKIVFSASLSEADWAKTRLVTTDATATVRELKEQPGNDLALFGSATLTVSLLEHGLVDELRVIVNPILLGDGVSLFSSLSGRVPLKLLRTTTFSSGNVLLSYQPISAGT
jgi:dihydrofolate reductase